VIDPEPVVTNGSADRALRRDRTLDDVGVMARGQLSLALRAEGPLPLVERAHGLDTLRAESLLPGVEHGRQLELLRRDSPVDEVWRYPDTRLLLVCEPAVAPRCRDGKHQRRTGDGGNE